VGEVLTLLSDIVSNGKGGKVYGKKGDEVRLISDRGGVLIVEDKKGERFPVKKEMVKEKL
jgi:hypothetical protein